MQITVRQIIDECFRVGLINSVLHQLTHQAVMTTDPFRSTTALELFRNRGVQIVQDGFLPTGQHAFAHRAGVGIGQTIQQIELLTIAHFFTECSKK